MKQYFVILVGIFAILLQNTQAQEKGSGDWWIENYGEVTRDQLPEIKRAEEIFDKIWLSSQPASIKKPRLLFLKESAGKWLDSWAISIADGSIIIVESLLPLAFNIDSADHQSGDSRLAFVLSHELAHLLHKDHKSLGVPLLFQVLSSKEEMETARKIELSADYKGIFIMTMAGYNPRDVLRADSTFFGEYAQKVRKKIRSIGNRKQKKRHPESNIRAEELRIRLKRFADQLQHFYLGVEAYQKQNLDMAEQHFHKFLKIYPGRETLNNLGLTLYQKARIYVSGCKGIHYKLIPATRLVTRTDAELLVPEETRISVDVKKQLPCQPDLFKKIISRADEYLEMARVKDRTFRPALINLTALQITRQEYKTAELEADNLLSGESSDPYAVNNRALALYLQNSELNREKSMRLLKRVPESSAIYKLAGRNLRMISGVENKSMMTPLVGDHGIDHDILKSIE